MKKSQKYVYVALIYEPGFVAKFIKFWTGYPYSHVTFSFDEKLEKNHAFSRKKESTPLVAGYVLENKNHYTLGKDVNINTIIYKIPVTNEEYKNIKEYIDEISKDKEYLYNYLSMITLAVIKGFRVYKSMHCTEFVAKILTMISSVKMSKKWYKYLPKDFDNDLKQYTIFNGIMDMSNIKKNDEDYFFKKVSFIKYMKVSLYIAREVMYRVIHRKCSPRFKPEKIEL